MKETYYAYGVARIRANELSLFSSSDMEQLISAQDYRAALRFLEDKGWEIDEANENFAPIIAKHSEKNWQLICECLNIGNELDSLIILNDFHNLKAALKATFADEDATEFFVTPCIVPPQEIVDAVTKNRYEALPSYIKPAARGAYNILVQTGNGQKADVFLDCAAVEAMCETAKSSDSQMLIKLANATADFANIKTAWRCIMTGKDTEFAESALSSCGTIKKDDLLLSIAEGVEELISLVSGSIYSALADSMKKGAAEFEKHCDDYLVEIVEVAKSKAFGVDPIAAYYIAQDAEIRNVRIILNCKLSHVDSETISKRVRKLYV